MPDSGTEALDAFEHGESAASPSTGGVSRAIGKHYLDPLDVVWVSTARALGIEVVRDREVFAAWDGATTLRLGTPETLDADDSLAQMILHEVCHALVAGPTAFHTPDWGLEYGRDEHLVYEHATLRLQAYLAGTVGLRDFFASTTDHRSYYETLPESPLAPDDSSHHSDPAMALAQRGLESAKSRGWYVTIVKALDATRAIRDVVAAFSTDTLWSDH